VPIGLSFPFSQSTGSLGYLEPTSDVISAIQANLRVLLLTNWGERPMRYEFGCNMREFLFEPATDELRGRIAERIRAQLAKWMPFLSLSELFINFTGEQGSAIENGVTVKMKVLYGNIPVNVTQGFEP
jgi:phage baseplate assembly protein W